MDNINLNINLNNNLNMEKFIRALSIDGSTIIDFVYSEETHLYHYEGDVSYAGYTKEELEPRRVS